MVRTFEHHSKAEVPRSYLVSIGQWQEMSLLLSDRIQTVRQSCKDNELVGLHVSVWSDELTIQGFFLLFFFYISVLDPELSTPFKFCLSQSYFFPLFPIFVVVSWTISIQSFLFHCPHNSCCMIAIAALLILPFMLLSYFALLRDIFSIPPFSLLISPRICCLIPPVQSIPLSFLSSSLLPILHSLLSSEHDILNHFSLLLSIGLYFLNIWVIIIHHSLSPSAPFLVDCDSWLSLFRSLFALANHRDSIVLRAAFTQFSVLFNLTTPLLF